MTNPLKYEGQEETATSTTLTVETPSTTQTTADVVERAGVLRSRAAALRGEVEELHDNANEVHAAAFDQHMEEATAMAARRSADSLLAELGEMGFSWRDVARLVGVSVSAIQKWRQGGGIRPEHRWHVAQIVALCNLLTQRPFHIEDVASWFEMRIDSRVPVTPLDLLAEDRMDLVIRWAGHVEATAEGVLDEFDSDWRDRYRSRFEVFTAADGQPGIRMTQE